MLPTIQAISRNQNAPFLKEDLPVSGPVVMGISYGPGRENATAGSCQDEARPLSRALAGASKDPYKSCTLRAMEAQL